MRYYCNICKRDITEGEFHYSIDKFDRPLCREHQDLERRNREKSFRSEQKEVQMMEQEPIKTEPEEMIDSENGSGDHASKSGWKSIGKVALKMGKGIVKGVKKVVSASKKRSQIRKWKAVLLRRMKMSQLKQLCFERKISTKKTVLEEDKSTEELYWKEYECSKADLVVRLRNKVPLDSIISFANRNHIGIRDIQLDIDRKKAEWELKDLTEKIVKNGGNFLLELEKTIREFVPLRRYDKEMYYQDTLASFLRSKFPSTKIEEPRGSTRPDIVVRGIAIEIKGPTNYKDLQTVADKCLRYTQNFPNGMICVLFNVNVTENRYNEWLKGLNTHYPDVRVLRISY